MKFMGLPIKTTKGERIFISIMLTFGICLLWLRFIEPDHPFSIWIPLLIGGAIGVIIFRRG